MFIPAHSKRVFVEGEVDMVSSVGYNPARRVPGANFSGVDLRLIITNLCVMDFGGQDNAIRLVSLHPGVLREEVVENTGFALEIPANVLETPAPAAQELDIIARLDPHNIRATVIKDNPAGRRQG
jgi:glutaconate CoA-transferase subunit B